MNSPVNIFSETCRKGNDGRGSSKGTRCAFRLRCEIGDRRAADEVIGLSRDSAAGSIDPGGLAMDVSERLLLAAAAASLMVIAATFLIGFGY